MASMQQSDSTLLDRRLPLCIWAAADCQAVSKPFYSSRSRSLSLPITIAISILSIFCASRIVSILIQQLPVSTTNLMLYTHWRSCSQSMAKWMTQELNGKTSFLIWFFILPQLSRSFGLGRGENHVVVAVAAVAVAVATSTAILIVS